MQKIKVKICGITNLDDALIAVEAGADYLGFIFYPPSKRSIDRSTCKQIVAQLRSRVDCPLLVGVFVNETADHMVQILQECALDLAQLSGEEVPFLVADKRSPLYGRSYKALRPSSLVEAEADAEWYTAPQQTPDQPTLLVDTYHATLRGGTGETGDWELSANLALKIPGLMLAGGLTAENVFAAVRQVRPFAVDTASGVETYPGKKDHQLLHEFIRQAKAT
ncbi:MAG: N-(5'-phosphoribosyl)anthranilate isomerase [Chloroflexi bacterium]|jgi:phosphoribosylanthranilate isomerase|nr:N-(5'-phosphoribosyl)anthranilate isomerase [Chloroflexota bacterium]